MAKLTPNQKIFIDEYLIDLNATRAYKVAYKNCKKDETARTNSSRLLTNANIKNHIQERMKEREKRTEITQDKVLKELAKIGFSDITDFVEIEKKGVFVAVKIKATEDIPKDKIGAIAGIKEGANGIEIKTNDKVKALELIGRHLGMFSDKLELSGEVNTNTDKLDKILEQLNE
nr:MAG TPA: Terminase small subunit [Caudoviricetes sp.]